MSKIEDLGHLLLHLAIASVIFQIAIAGRVIAMDSVINTALAGGAVVFIARVFQKRNIE